VRRIYRHIEDPVMTVAAMIAFTGLVLFVFLILVLLLALGF
jgi:hypothetical protein